MHPSESETLGRRSDSTDYGARTTLASMAQQTATMQRRIDCLERVVETLGPIRFDHVGGIDVASPPDEMTPGWRVGYAARVLRDLDSLWSGTAFHAQAVAAAAVIRRLAK